MIEKISSALISLLSAGLSDTLKPGQVGLCLPFEPGETVLGLYLYSIRQCTDVNTPALSMKGRNVLALPPNFLTLHYLLTSHSKADAPHRAAEDHRVLYRAMQIFAAVPSLTERELGFVPGHWVDELKLQFVDLPHESMARAWEFKDTPYRLSVAYRVCPVELPGLEGRMVGRVSGADLKGGQL